MGGDWDICPHRDISFKNDYETISTGLRGTSRVHEQSLGFSLEARCTLFLLEIMPSVIYLEHKLFQRCCSWRGCQAVSRPFMDRAAARFMCDLSPLSSGPCRSLSLWVVSVKLLQSKPYLFSYQWHFKERQSGYLPFLSRDCFPRRQENNLPPWNWLAISWALVSCTWWLSARGHRRALVKRRAGGEGRDELCYLWRIAFKSITCVKDFPRDSRRESTLWNFFLAFYACKLE